MPSTSVVRTRRRGLAATRLGVGWPHLDRPSARRGVVPSRRRRAGPWPHRARARAVPARRRPRLRSPAGKRHASRLSWVPNGMLTFVRDVTAQAPLHQVHEYLADFSRVNEWDPRASRARRVRGDGGEGTEYECEVSFARRTVPMRYTVTRLVPGETIEWVGESPLVRAHDVIRLRPESGYTHVEYTTQYRYRRASWLLDRLLRRAISRLCDDARDGLQATLDRQGRGPSTS